MSSPDVIVVGAGVLGLCTAAELGARGHAVTVIDPGGPNASSVAAGMIAPALESLLDALPPERADLLRRAADLWPAFADRHGLALHRDGADWHGPDAKAAIDRLHELGFAAKAQPGGLFTPDDARVEVAGALTALAKAEGVSLVRARVARLAGAARRWRVDAEGGRTWFSPTIVIATGVAAAVPGLPDATTRLIETIQPIRGQVIIVSGVQTARTQRSAEAYVVPAGQGVLIGAGMELGRRDLDPDMDEAANRALAGLALLGTAGDVGLVRVGVRGASADGLPLAGPAGEAGLHLALASRRNGWLLGPLVAQVVADGIEGRAPSIDAATLDPLRFA